jgi:hypothetical protein
MDFTYKIIGDQIKDPMITVGMGTSSYNFETSLNFIFKFYICQNSHIINRFEIVKF